MKWKIHQILSGSFENHPNKTYFALFQDRDEQTKLEMKHRQEEDDLYRKFSKHREEENRRIREEIQVSYTINVSNPKTQ